MRRLERQYPPVLLALFEMLPRDARWTPAERERWMVALEAIVRLLYKSEPGAYRPSHRVRPIDPPY